MIYRDQLGRAELWVTRKHKIQFPIVLLKTYNNLLLEYERREIHYWKQYAHRINPQKEEK